MAQFTVLKVEKEQQPGKDYAVTSVSYKTYDGKVKGMKVFPFKEQALVAAAFDGAQPGDVYETNFEKNAKGFWQFAPTPTKTGEKASVTPSAPAAKGNWETSDERAARQVMIVKQSSLSNGVAFLAAKYPKGIPDEFRVGDLIDVARQLEEYVLHNKKPATGDVE